MLKRKLFQMKILSRRLSIRAAAFAIFAVISSLAAVLFNNYVPNDLADLVGGKAVDGILSMMASSMLIVVTFALSTMVSAYSTATQIATPRATALLIDDARSHSAISVFLGAFIYSVVSLIALSTGYYGAKGRVILLLISVLLLVAVVWTIIRWVEELKNMGSVRESIRRVEEITHQAFNERIEQPTFGCEVFKSVPRSFRPVSSLLIGHIQNIDISMMVKISEENAMQIYVENDVGTFLHFGSNVALISEEYIADEKLLQKIRDCFIIGDSRTFDYDPRYGVTVLSGIAIKALSPSLNDPGTAVDVIGSLVRVLSYWGKKDMHCNKQITHPRIFFPEISAHDLFNDAFYGLAKEGAGNVQVIKALLHGLEALEATGSEKIIKEVAEHRNLVKARMSETQDPNMILRYLKQ